MRIFNEDKTQELFNVDLTNGELIDDELITYIAEQQEVKEISHFEVVRTYPNGGKDVEKIIDVEGIPYKAAHEETEKIKVYKPFSDEHIRKIACEKTLRELEDWFDRYFTRQIVESLWQENFTVSYDSYFKLSYEDIEQLKIKAQKVREEIILLREELKK